MSVTNRLFWVFTACLLAPVIAVAQEPWTVTLKPTLNPLPIGMCGAIELTVLDASGKDAPRNPRGSRVTIADFDIAVTTRRGAFAVAQRLDPYHWYACACQGGSAGTEGTVTATYPAQALEPASRVRGVAFQKTATFVLAEPKGSDNPRACLTAEGPRPSGPRPIAASLPDLVPLTLSVSTGVATVGGQVSFTSIVQNPFSPPDATTSPDALNASATFYLGTPENTLLAIGKTTPGITIAGGQSQIFNRSWNIPSNYMPGTYDFYVKADADNGVSERSETNNILGSTVPMTLLPQPPTNVTGVQLPAAVNNAAIRRVEVSFAPSSSAGVVRYDVYRDASKVGSVLATTCGATCRFTDLQDGATNNLVEDGTYVYTSRAVAVIGSGEVVSNSSNAASVAVSLR